MQLYLFWSEMDTGVFGFTFNSEGGNLPIEFGPWLKNDDGQALYSGPGKDIESNKIIKIVQRDGFCLVRNGRIRDLVPAF
jgi:hypothetical protein